MVNKHKDGWRVDFSIHRNGKRERVRRQFETQLKAATWEEWATERIKQGLPLEEVVATRDGTGWTMESLCTAVHARYWKGSANEENALRNAEECVEILGCDEHPANVTATKVDHLVATLVTKGNSAATINRKLSALGKLLSHAVSRGVITHKPQMDRQKESAGRLRWYSREEEGKILAHLSAEDPELRDLVVFLADTGARLTEALMIQWRDVDTYARFHETKNGTRRAVPLTDRVQAMLATRRSDQADITRVFPEGDKHSWGKRWDKARRAVGLSKDAQAVLHTWRHTCASRLVQGGVGIQVVQQWLGHKSIQITLRYAHLAPTNLVAAAAVLNSLDTSGTDILRPSNSGHSVTRVSSSEVKDAA